jgi:predicted AAA+ superfamily ATPase
MKQFKIKYLILNEEYNIFSKRFAKNIENWLFKDKIILIYGARQVGKTTLCRQILTNTTKQKIKRLRAFWLIQIPSLRQLIEKTGMSF